VPEASVLIHAETGEPTLLNADDQKLLNDSLTGGIRLEDYRVVSEWALRIAVATLQTVYRTSTCLGSRAQAEAALKAVAQAGDLPADPVTHMPVPVVIPREQRPHNLTALDNPYTLGA
jgi:hypothetical protein